MLNFGLEVLATIIVCCVLSANVHNLFKGEVDKTTIKVDKK